MAITTVHIIDDEQQVADMLGEFVQLIGYPVQIYTQATLFFEKNKNPDQQSVLILDLNMPEMDGIEVMRQLSEKGFSMPLILVSGYDSSVLHSAEQLAIAHSLEIIATITKPIHFKVLQTILLEYNHAEDSSKASSNVDDLQLTPDELEHAIDHKQLILHYQPQVDLKTGATSGIEALVRWNHPRHGIIFPDLFIPMAEKNGFMGKLTTQVINQAVRHSLLWKKENLSFQVSINISAENITSLTLPEQLSEQLSKHNLDSSMLTLEITESALMGRLETSLDILTRLRMRGIELSIDDFGTGYSSLSQLYRIPFTELKIDQSFVIPMAHDDEAKGIVKTCIMLGHELKMRVVAEGVEDQETMDLLRDMGCDIAQGYFISRPMPADDIIIWAHQRET